MNGLKRLLMKAQSALQRFMTGRYGPDPLSQALTYGALACLFLALIPALGGLALLSYAAFIWACARMLSRNLPARRKENQWYLSQTYALGVFFRRMKRTVQQAWARARNHGQYLYFRCPKCHTLMRLPRGLGSVTVTCKVCSNVFEKNTRTSRLHASAAAADGKKD